MNFLSNILREEGGFEYKKAIVDSIVILIRDIPDAKESGLLHLCEFIEDCEFTYLSTQVALYLIIICYTMSPWLFFFHLISIKFHLIWMLLDSPFSGDWRAKNFRSQQIYTVHLQSSTSWKCNSSGQCCEHIGKVWCSGWFIEGIIYLTFAHKWLVLVGLLVMYAWHIPFQPRIFVLLRRCLFDSDDEVSL